MTTCPIEFQVLFTKDGNKKRKIYHDGILTSTQKANGCIVVLKNDANKEIFRKSLGSANYQCGTEIKLGLYDIMIEKENSPGLTALTANSCLDVGRDTINSTIEQRKTNKSSLLTTCNPSVQYYSSHHLVSSSYNQSSEACAPPSGTRKRTHPTDAHLPCPPFARRKTREVALDECLLRVMHPHQIEGARFLLGCLQTPVPPTANCTEGSSFPSRCGGNASEDGGGERDEFFMREVGDEGEAEGERRLRGAILADEMGTCCAACLSAFRCVSVYIYMAAWVCRSE